MKRIYVLLTFLPVLLTGGLLTGCQEEAAVDSPRACFDIFVESAPGERQPAETAKVGNNVIFVLCSPARRYTLWTGDQGHDINGSKVAYDEKKKTADPLNTGLNINVADGEIVYKYSQPGTYSVALIATNVVYAGEVKADTLFKTITITR